ncbi:hypothetical protein GPALN_003390 [Globodera pallida]|nr:hypothetical protein GPALN_003390 [Globodera pallida]
MNNAEQLRKSNSALQTLRQIILLEVPEHNQRNAASRVVQGIIDSISWAVPGIAQQVGWPIAPDLQDYVNVALKKADAVVRKVVAFETHDQSHIEHLFIALNQLNTELSNTVW